MYPIKNTLNRFLALFFIFFLFFSVWAKAQTIVAAGSQVEGRWTRDKSPYRLLGAVTVPEGFTLRIEKGVEVQFQTWEGSSRVEESQAGWLRIQGRLLAEGTERERIVFTRSGTEGCWGVLLLDSLSHGNVLEHCVVQFAGQMEGIRGEYQVYGGVGAFKSDVVIRHCIITSNKAYGITCALGSNVVIENTLIAGNFGAGIGCFDVGPKLEKTTITDNTGIGLYGYRESEPLLRRCVIVGNAEALHSEAAILKDCLIDQAPHGQAIRTEDTDLVQAAPPHLSWILGEHPLPAIVEWAGKGKGCSWLRDADSRGRLSVFLR
jgi:Right handed beta helix region